MAGLCWRSCRAELFGLLWGRSSYLGSGCVWITELVCRRFPLVDLGLGQGAERKLCFPLLPCVTMQSPPLPSEAPVKDMSGPGFEAPVWLSSYPS